MFLFGLSTKQRYCRDENVSLGILESQGLRNKWSLVAIEKGTLTSETSALAVP